MPARTGEVINKQPGYLGVEPISMRVNDACRFTGISRSTLYLLIASGEVEIIKLGATTLVVTESLRRFVNEKRRCISR
jgi:excisionase family DNA binding protein